MLHLVKLDFGSLVLGSSQFFLLPQLSQKMLLASKVSWKYSSHFLSLNPWHTLCYQFGQPHVGFQQNPDLMNDTTNTKVFLSSKWSNLAKNYHCIFVRKQTNLEQFWSGVRRWSTECVEVLINRIDLRRESEVANLRDQFHQSIVWRLKHIRIDRSTLT